MLNAPASTQVLQRVQYLSVNMFDHETESTAFLNMPIVNNWFVRFLENHVYSMAEPGLAPGPSRSSMRS